MGIYIFTTSKLKEFLEADNEDPESSNDFGKNVIPAMLAAGCRMYAYTFEGYWKDVGTLTSLWEANMDLLGNPPKFDLYDRKWRIFYRHNAYPPHRIGAAARLANSMVTEGCVIDGTVENSILSNDVHVEAGAVVRDSVIMSGVTVKAGAHISYAIVDSDTVIGENASLGDAREGGSLLVLASGLSLPAGTAIRGGELVDKDSLARFIGKEDT